MIQVTLNANEFNFTGEHEGRQYTSLRIQRISNGRVYFFTMKDGIKWNTMIKQMKLDNGHVYISFGKQGKLIIGTYVDDTAIIEEVVTEPTQEVVKPNQPKSSRELVETITNDNYIIDVYTWLSHDNIQCYYIEVKDIHTNQVIEEISDIVYLSREAAYKFIKSINPIKETKSYNEPTKATKQATNEQPVKLNMIANYGKILFKSNQVDVIFSNDNKEETVTFKRKKSWSNKKYIDLSFKLYGVKPAWDFRYGWEYVN